VPSINEDLLLFDVEPSLTSENLLSTRKRITWHSLKRFQKEIDQMQERMCISTVFAKSNLHQSILMGKRVIKLLLIAARRWG